MRFYQKLTHLLIAYSISLLSFQPYFSLVSEVQAQTTLTEEQQRIKDENDGTRIKRIEQTKLSKDINDEDFITNLTALAATFVTTTIVLSCKPVSTDMYIAAGGGAIWMAGEIMAAMKYKKAAAQLEQKFMTEYSTQEADREKQIESLITLKASYEEAKSVIKQKLNMQRVGMIAYTLAAVVSMASTMEWFSSTGVTCEPTTPAAAKLKMIGNGQFLALIYTLKSLILNSHASSSPFWFLGGAALTFFMKTTVAESTAIKSLMVSPWSRAVAWGAIGLLLKLSMNKTEGTLDNIESNISRLDMIIQKLQTFKKGGVAAGPKAHELATKKLGAFKSPNVKISDNKKQTTICATSGTVGACPSVETALSKLPSFSGLPEGIQNIATQIAKGADGVGGKDEIQGGTLTNIGNLSNKSSAINSALKKKLSEIQAKGNAKHKTNNDLDKEAEKKALGLKNIVRKQLQSSGLSAAAANNAISGFSSLAGTGENANKLTDEDTKKGESGAAPAISLAPSSDAKNDLAGLDFNFKDDQAAALGRSDSMTASNALDELQMEDASVNPDAKKNIFDIISGRYIKSAYPALLEEEK